MTLGRAVAPPAAWIALIAREPRLALRAYRPGRVAMTPVRVAQLGSVQDSVNATIRYVPDTPGRDVWGVLGWRKVWGLTGRRWVRVGDCDDYAVAKLRRLLGLGFGGSLRLVACRYGRVPHLVVAVDTTSSTLILDNRIPGVWPWDDPRFAGYRWIKSSVPGRLRWARVGQPRTLEDLARIVA